MTPKELSDARALVRKQAAWAKEQASKCAIVSADELDEQGIKVLEGTGASAYRFGLLDDGQVFFTAVEQ